MKKILYIIVILVVLGLIFFMFPGVYLKYSITNKLPKEKYSLVYIKPTLKQIDTYLDSGKQYEIGDLLFKVKDSVTSYDIKQAPDGGLMGVMKIEGGKKIIISAFKNNLGEFEKIASITPNDMRIFDSRSDSKMKYKLLFYKALTFPHRNSKIFNLFQTKYFSVLQNSSNDYTTTSLYLSSNEFPYLDKGVFSFHIILKGFNQDQIEELISSFDIELGMP